MPTAQLLEDPLREMPSAHWFSLLCQLQTYLLKLAHDDTAPGVLQHDSLFQTAYLLL